MKRLSILLFTILALFSLIACQKPTTTTTTAPVVTARLSAPSNLRINEKILSWDPVSNATSYDIYINDVFHSTKTTPSFDFSAVSGNQLVFRVIAKGNQILPSLHSASVAYVANATQEAQTIFFYLQDFMPGASMEVANEMVRKGMTGTEFLALKTAMETMTAEMNSVDSASGLYTLVNPLVTGNHNYEALISGYLLAIESNTYNPIAQMIAENSHEDVVLILVRLIAFLQSFQQAFNPTLLGRIDNIVENEIETITAQEVVVIRDELIEVFQSTLPGTADFILLYEFLASMMESAGGSATLVSTLRDNSSTLATANRMSIQLYLDYIDSLPLSFFQSFLTILSDPLSEEMKSVELNILNLKSYKVFMDANQSRVDAIKNLVPVAQQQILYTQFQNSMAGMLESFQVNEMVLNPIVDIVQALTFAQVQSLSQLDQEIANSVLSYLVSTNGELLRLQAIAGGFTVSFDYLGNATYENRVTLATYLTETAYYRAQELANLRATNEGVNLLAEVLTQISETDLRLVMDVFIAAIPYTFGSINSENDPTAFQAALEVYLNTNLSLIHELMLAFVNHLKNAQVINGIQSTYDAVHNYNVALWGPNYRDNPSWSSEFEEFAVKIYLAEAIDDFMTPTNKTKIDTLITNIFIELKKPNVALFLERDITEIDEIESAVKSGFELFLSEAQTIQTYSFTTLTEAQKDRVRNWGN